MDQSREQSLNNPNGPSMESLETASLLDFIEFLNAAMDDARDDECEFAVPFRHQGKRVVIQFNARRIRPS